MFPKRTALVIVLGWDPLYFGRGGKNLPFFRAHFFGGKPGFGEIGCFPFCDPPGNFPGFGNPLLGLVFSSLGGAIEQCFGAVF